MNFEGGYGGGGLPGIPRVQKPPSDPADESEGPVEDILTQLCGARPLSPSEVGTAPVRMDGVSFSSCGTRAQ